MTVVGRFAPSPSGRMHLGNLFSAVLAWLGVRSAGGTMVLRIEDLDPDRCRPEFAEQVKRDLGWLGLDWDVEQTPQSRRGEAYRLQFEKLETLGLIYPCYCTRGELHAASAPHASDGNPVYAGTCRNLTPTERAAKTKTPCWRILVPDEIISFTDGLQGSFSENLAKSCGDFIVRRADGVYAYQLAVTTDDAAAGVTQVVRGCDLLSSVPRQIYLHRLLGFATPVYYHVPLLVSADGRRLSKRDRDLDLEALMQRYTPQALLGHIGFLAGLIPEDAPISLSELAAIFDWNRVRSENIIV